VLERSGVAPSVGAVVVTWSGLDHARECLRSLLRSHYPDLRVCLVDNGSPLNIGRTLAAEFPPVEVIRLEDNGGYAAGCNAGLRWAQDRGIDYALLLNDDTIADPGMVSALVDRAHSLGGAIVAPKILHSSEAGAVWSTGGRIRRPWFKADHIASDVADSDEARQVEWASGCALMVPVPLLSRVGVLDERYFLYLEDVDWCLRALRHGVPVWYEPAAKLWHEVSSSVDDLDNRSVRYYSYRNHYLLAFTHSGWVGRFWFSLHFTITWAKIAARTAFFPRYRRDGWYHARTRAMFDFLRGRFGRAPYDDPEPAMTSEVRVA